MSYVCDARRKEERGREGRRKDGGKEARGRGKALSCVLVPTLPSRRAVASAVLLHE